MKHFFLTCLLGLLLLTPDSHAQHQRPVRFADLLLRMPQHANRAASAGTAHRNTSTITVPGRSVEHEWSPSGWSNGSVATYTYDARGNATQIVYTDSATARPVGKILFAYNLRNQLTEQTEQTWRGSTYVNEERKQLTYDTQGYPTLEVYQTWGGTAWVTDESYRTTNSYNSANVLTSQVFEELNINSNVWERRGRILYTVNASNQWTEVVYQDWINGVYENDDRTHNITWYDWRQLLVSYYEDQEWDNGAWSNVQRSTVTYQANNSNVEIQQRFTAPSTWVNDDRITTTYDNFGNLILSQFDSWTGSAWVVVDAERRLLSYTPTNEVRRALDQYYDTSLNRYLNSYLTTYSNFLTLGVRRASGLEAAATLHPNPTAGTATLVLRGLHDQGTVPAEVLNLLGQVVQTLVVRSHQGVINQQIDLASLPAGIYTVRLHTAEGTVAKRIVKQ